HVRWLPLEARHELRARQDRSQSRAYPALEVAALAAVPVELHERVDLFILERTPVCSLRELAENRARARLLFLGLHGPAVEDTPPTRRIGDVGRVERTRDVQMLEARQLEQLRHRDCVADRAFDRRD